MPTDESSTFLPGIQEQQEGGAGSHRRHPRLGGTRRFLRLAQKVALHALASGGAPPNPTPHPRVRRGLSEGPAASGGKGKERVERNQRNHHRWKLLKAHTHLHTGMHRCLGNQVNHPTPPRGRRDPLFWARRGSWPGGKRDGARGSSLRPALGLVPLGAYRVKEHDSAGTGGADGKTGVP